MINRFNGNNKAKLLLENFEPFGIHLKNLALDDW